MTDNMRSRVLGMILALCSRGQFPQREPVAFLYGHVAKEGETPTHTINGVGYVGAVCPDIYTVYTPELQKTHPFAIISEAGGTIQLHLGKELLYETVDGDRRYTLTSPKHAGITETDTGKVWDEPWDGIGDYWDRLYAPYTQWTNTNLLSEDGSIFIEAIKPIPIYE